jgi:hypothetical protein
MAFSFNGSSQLLLVSTCPEVRVPFSLAVLARPAVASSGGALLHLGPFSNSEYRFNLIFNAGRPQLNFGNAVPVSGSMAAPSAISANTWVSIVMVAESTSMRRLYVNGTQVATNTTVLTEPGGNVFERISIGARRLASGVTDSYFNGAVAEVGIWSAALSASQAASIGVGYAAAKVRPSSLIFDARLIRERQDLRGARSISNVGAASVFNHPRIIG